MKLDARLRARTIEQTRQEPSPTRTEMAARQRAITLAVALATLFVFMGAGGVRMGPRPAALLLQTALGSSALALGAAVAALGRGGSMLGRPRSRLVTVAVATPISLLAWRVIASSRYPFMLAQWAERPGLRCLLLSGILSLLPLAVLLWMRRGSDPIHPRASAAALGTVAGAVGWVLVDMWCPVSYIPHLLLGHVLPLGLIVLASIVFGSRIVVVRAP